MQSSAALRRTSFDAANSRSGLGHVDVLDLFIRIAS
jgi:hypothetical protein